MMSNTTRAHYQLPMTTKREIFTSTLLPAFPFKFTVAEHKLSILILPACDRPGCHMQIINVMSIHSLFTAISCTAWYTQGHVKLISCTVSFRYAKTHTPSYPACHRNEETTDDQQPSPQFCCMPKLGCVYLQSIDWVDYR